MTNKNNQNKQEEKEIKEEIKKGRFFGDPAIFVEE